MGRTWRHAGVMVVAHDAGTAAATGRAAGATEGCVRRAVNLGREAKGARKLVVGWKKSICSFRAAGTEYSSVRMLVAPVSMCVKTEKLVESSSFALDTGMVISSMSPAGVTGLNEMLFSLSHSVMAATVSSVGFTNEATWEGLATDCAEHTIINGPPLGSGTVRRLVVLHQYHGIEGRDRNARADAGSLTW